MTTSETTERGAAAPDDDGGRMPLSAHLRELRSRLVKAFLAVGVGFTVAWIYFQPLFDLVQRPLKPLIAQAQAEGRDATLVIGDITGAFMLQVKISLLVGMIVASPVWIYQLWRFVTPGLHKHERRWSIGFIAVSIPLFLTGVTVGYLLMPKGLGLLLGFTPEGVANFLSVDKYLSFFIRTIIVFGISFLVPVFIVALNFAGILTAGVLARSWRWIIFSTFVFAAVATPSGDPWTMTLLAAPMLVLIGLALLVCWANDRRRARNSNEPDYGDLDDDAASPIDRPDPIEPSDLDDDPTPDDR